MGRWRPLPGDLPPEVARLVKDMRRQVDRSGASAASVAARTGYSRSSWLRYLSGRRLPPWPAVEGLGRLAHADWERLRVLWESAADAWARTGGTQRAGEAPDEPTARRAADDPETAPGTAHGGAALGTEGPGGETPATSPHAGAIRRPRADLPVVGAVVGCALMAGVLVLSAVDTRAGADTQAAPAGSPAWPWALDSRADQGAAPCRAAGCRGLDPYREGCARDGVAVHRMNAYGHTLTLRYSPSCGSSWAEVDPPAAASGLRVATNGGQQEEAGAGQAYTAMVGGDPGAARATVVVAGHQLGAARYDSWIDPVTGTGRG